MPTIKPCGCRYYRDKVVYECYKCKEARTKKDNGMNVLENLKFEMVEEVKTTSNFMLNNALKRAFKIECARNGSTMSSVLETLMISYVVQAAEMREKLKNQENDS